MTYGNLNVDTVTTSTAGGILGAGNASIMKNRLINGAMTISQRNGTTATSQTNGSYSLDRWYSLSYDGSVTTNKYTVTQSSTAATGFTNSLLVTSSAATSSGASDIYTVGQAIEGYNIADLGWGTANAKTVTLSFWVRSSVTGTFGVFIRNAALDYSYPTTYTITAANTWEYKTITISGPTSGTWPTNNSAGLYVWFQLQVGSSLVATPNTWTSAGAYGASGCVSLLNTSGATWYATGVQLEIGSSATGFEYRQYTTELQLCQRYLPIINTSGATGGYSWITTGYAANSTIVYGLVYPFKVTPRVPPTGITTVNPTSSFNVTFFGGTSAVTAITYMGGTLDSGGFYVNTTGATGGQGVSLNAVNGSGQIQFTGCEL